MHGIPGHHTVAAQTGAVERDNRYAFVLNLARAE